MKKLKYYPKKAVLDFLKLYFLVFSTVVIGIAVVRGVSGRSSQGVVVSRAYTDGANSSYPESDITLTVGGMKYFLVYEKESDKYLVFAGYNHYLGFVALPSGESITSVTEHNLLDKIQLDN